MVRAHSGARLSIGESTVDDSVFMRKALELAHTAAERGDVPVGAVLVNDGEIAAVGFNQKEANHDPTAHAEMVAIRQAAARLGGWRLADATLFVTKEPCVMCAGACIAARIRRLVYACADPKGGGAGSVFDLTNSDLMNHRLVVEKGLLEDEAATMLRTFFKDRREKNAEF
ncbi:MAG TPA: tRNA adenosine(34) deaminase TadA [Candidatus Eremiobacteraceae bacterium]|nr:tRNA adenosine(34) deaminase TadA [Candidatus Eremiobacteraceae bacterium]